VSGGRVGDDHRAARERGLERRGAARDQRRVGRVQREVRVAEEDRDRQVARLEA
jgi:hypothetical protein